MGIVLIIDHERLFFWGSDDAVSVEAALQRHTLWRALAVRSTTTYDNYLVQFKRLIDGPRIEAVYAMDSNGIYKHDEETGQLYEVEDAEEEEEDIAELLLAVYRDELELLPLANGIHVSTLNSEIKKAKRTIGKIDWVTSNFQNDQVIMWKGQQWKKDSIKDDLRHNHRHDLSQWFCRGSSFEYEVPEDEFTVDEELIWNSDDNAVMKPDLRAKEIRDATSLPELKRIMENVEEENMEDEVLSSLEQLIGIRHAEWYEILPRFGGEEPTPGKPYYQSTFWSWDEDEVLIGNSFSELHRVDRDELEDDQDKEDLWMVTDEEAVSLDEDTQLQPATELGKTWWIIEHKGPKRAVKEAKKLSSQGEEAGRKEAERLLGTWHGDAIDRAKEHLAGVIAVDEDES